MTRTPVMAAGGIVLRQGRPPLIAVVRLRKRDEWVLPKGKLDVGETPRDAAIREVKEETGHDVALHEFLGTLVYESGGRSKIVHYWRMEPCGGPVHELMNDVREVDWLPVDAAVERLSRGYERAFLANIGPLAVRSALANQSRRKTKAAAPKKRRSRPSAPAQPPLAEPIPAQPAAAELPVVAPDASDAVASDIVGTEPPAPMATVDPSDQVPTVDPPAPVAAADPPPPTHVDPISPTEAGELVDERVTGCIEGPRKSLAQKVRDWLRRAA